MSGEKARQTQKGSSEKALVSARGMRGISRARRSAAARIIMDSAHMKPGWYWLRRREATTVEIGFWTGTSFILISPDRSTGAEDVERCSEGPLEPPEDYNLIQIRVVADSPRRFVRNRTDA